MAGGVKIIVFDWGGVILRICRSWAEGCERAGLAVRDGSDTPELVSARQRIAHDYQIGATDCETFCHSLSDAMNSLYTTDEMRRIHDAWLIEEYPGMRELIGRLAEHSGVTTGLLSNTNHLHWIQHLPHAEGGTARFPSARLLDHRHASHLLGVAKPEGGIYARFEAETGYSESEILFFDDLSENIEAARERGWCAEQVDHTGDTAEQVARCLAAHGVF